MLVAQSQPEPLFGPHFHSFVERSKADMLAHIHYINERRSQNERRKLAAEVAYSFHRMPASSSTAAIDAVENECLERRKNKVIWTKRHGIRFLCKGYCRTAQIPVLNEHLLFIQASIFPSYKAKGERSRFPSIF